MAVAWCRFVFGEFESGFPVCTVCDLGLGALLHFARPSEPTGNPDAWEGLCLFYSYLPVVLIALYGLEVAIFREELEAGRTRLCGILRSDNRGVHKAGGVVAEARSCYWTQ